MAGLTDPKAKLDLSVLLATYNRAELLEKTLSQLRQQVIRGKNRSLNKALKYAKGELLIFTDDDISASKVWLAELSRAALQNSEYNIFCGPIFPIYPPDTPEWFNPNNIYAVLAFSKFISSQSEGPLKTTILPFGPNYAIRAKSMKDMRFCHSLGPQQAENATLGGQSDRLQRLAERGERVFYVPTASVSHFVGKHLFELGWFYERAYRFGRGLVRINPDRKSRYFFNVPWYLWHRVSMSWIKYILVSIRFILNESLGNWMRLHIGSSFYINRGQI